MIYDVEVKKQAEKFLNKQQKHIKERVISWLEKLKENPYEENDGVVVNYSVDEKQVYKKRIGDIRIFFIVYDDIVKIIITKAQNRVQAYK